MIYRVGLQNISSSAVTLMDRKSNSMLHLMQRDRPPSAGSPTQFYRRPLPSNCIAFSSPEGKAVFQEAMKSGNMEGYFRLASQFLTQDHPAYCGLATLVMCLNSLEVDPGRVWKGPWRWFHEEMLDCCVPLSKVRSSGITMAEFVCLAECNLLQVEQLVIATESASIEEFQRAAQACSQSEEKILVVSYGRQGLDQTGDGHFAPIGGYHPDRRLLLVMDTARFKYPAHWVPLEKMWAALHYPDSVTGQPRGYCILTRAFGSAPAPRLFRISPRFLAAVMATRRPGLDDLRCPAAANAAASKLSDDSVNRSRASLLRLVGEFGDWLVQSAVVVDEQEEADRHLATFAAAAGQLRRLCECLKLRELPLGPQFDAQEAADAVAAAAPTDEIDELASALAALAALAASAAAAVVLEAFAGWRFPTEAGKNDDVNDDGEFDEALGATAAAGDAGVLALALLMSWPLDRLESGSWAAALASARDWALADLPESAANEMRALQRRLGSLIRRHHLCCSCLRSCEKC